MISYGAVFLPGHLKSDSVRNILIGESLIAASVQKNNGASLSLLLGDQTPVASLDCFDRKKDLKYRVAGLSLLINCSEKRFL